MNISKEDLVRVNKGFGGALRTDSSLDFAFDRITNKKLGSYKKLAYLVRALLVDHPFSDGNKRTAAFVALVFADKYKKQVNNEMLLHQIVSIAKNKVNDLRNIEWRLKNAIR